MFHGRPKKPYLQKEYDEARRLRSEEGTPMKQIAERLGVSPGTVHSWTHDIVLKPEFAARNARAGWKAGRGVKSASFRARRAAFQEAGRLAAQEGDPLHQMGCMLYWAEGSKERNACIFANPDLEMVRVFHRFLRVSLGVPEDRISVRLNVYLGNGLSLREIEDWWLDALGLPRSCLRKHTINHFPTSSSGKRKNKLPYGVCTLRVLKSTAIVQHIYGAIQEYGGFDEPRWLDCDRQKPARPTPPLEPKFTLLCHSEYERFFGEPVRS